MNLIEEHHTDHQKVMTALSELRQAIAHRDIACVRSILGAAEGVVGPHFKFEQLHLFPALERFLDETYTQKLYFEHDEAFRSVRRLAQLAQKDAWSEADYQYAMANLELIDEHLISCEGLSLWMERLSPSEQDQLLGKMRAVREQGTKLSEY